ARAANAVLAAGHAGPPQAYAPYDHAQGKGQQQEVNPTDPGGQQSENAGRESRSEYTEKTTDPGRSAHDRRPVDDDVRRDPENRAVTERYTAGVAGEHVDRHGEQCEYQHLVGETQLVRRDEGRQGAENGGQHDDEGQRRMPNGSDRRRHQAALPNKPRGRKARSTAIGPKMTKYASSGNRTWPIVLSMPTSNAPTAAPTRLPLPPMITIAREKTRISESAVG